MAERSGAKGVVVVTGGTRGIGRAVSVLAAAYGWDVAAAYVNRQDSADSTLEAIRAAGRRGYVAACDVSQEDDVLSFFDQTERVLGPIKAVVNNAAIVAPLAKLSDMSRDRMARVFDVNILGAFLVAREAARRLEPSGAIVNVSSAAALLGSPGEYVDYAATKGAVDTLTVGLAKELANRGIRVNGVRPGIIDTDIHETSGVADRARVLGAQVPLGRPGSAAEVAEAILWLLSDGASYVTGAIVNVTGGR